MVQPSTGTAFPVGTNLVTAVAADSAGNTNSCSFTVTVLAGPPPLMSIAQSGTNVVLCWSNAPCYVLQFAEQLLATNSWANYTGPLTTNGGNIYATNGIGTTNRFYRLTY